MVAVPGPVTQAAQPRGGAGTGDVPGGGAMDVALARALLDVLSEPPVTNDPGAPLALVAATDALAASGQRLLAGAVDEARAAGHSWSEIGAALGVSRQAAQQRFSASREPGPEAADDSVRWLGPVTRATEMDELALAGEAGWMLDAPGSSRHRLTRTNQPWEHARASIFSREATRLVEQGWRLVGVRGPHAHLVRPVASAAADH